MSDIACPNYAVLKLAIDVPETQTWQWGEIPPDPIPGWEFVVTNEHGGENQRLYTRRSS